MTARFRRFGEYVESDCDRWNADDREPSLIVHTFDGEPLSAPPSTEYTFSNPDRSERRVKK